MIDFKISNNNEASKYISIFGQSEPVIDENSEKGIYIGRTALYNSPFFLDHSMLMNPHICAIGTTGSGKSYFLKNYIIRSFNAGINNILIIDWNNEYLEVMNFIYGKTIFLGSENHINIFEIFKNKMKAAEYTTSSIVSMLGLDSNEKAMLYNIISSALMEEENEHVNLRYIMNMMSMPSMRMLRLKLAELLNSNIFADTNTFDPESLLNGVCSLNISRLDSDAQRKLVVSAFLDLLIEFMHNMQISEANRRLVVIDEAWKIIDANKSFVQLFREGRKYGISIAIATQNLKDIPLSILSNIASVFIFRMQNSEDVESLMNAKILDKKFEDLPSKLETGSCIVHLIYKSKLVKNFMIKKVDGLITNICNLKIDDNMMAKISIEKIVEEANIFFRRDMVEKIREFIESNNRDIELSALIKMLIKEGSSRSEIVAYLRALDINDLAIVSSINNLEI
ncbi:MAG: ATP-binding protein [Candidatus Micrarchaeia archaeon]